MAGMMRVAATSLAPTSAHRSVLINRLHSGRLGFDRCTISDSPAVATRADDGRCRGTQRCLADGWLRHQHSSKDSVIRAAPRLGRRMYKPRLIARQAGTAVTVNNHSYDSR